MSTKVYDAYRLPEHTDVLALPAQLSAAILPARLRADAQAIYDCAIHNADRYSTHRDLDRMPQGRRHSTAELAPLYQPDWPWYGAIAILQQVERAESPSSTFHDRHRFGVRLLRDPADQRLLALVDAPQPSISEAFAAFAAEHGWDDWHYQNQTDQPDDVSDDEWDERRRSWDRTLFDATGTEDAELRIRVAPQLSYNTAPSVMGIGEDEEAAIAQVNLATPAQRLARLLMDARSAARRDAPDQVISAYLSDRDALRAVIAADNPRWVELLEQMPEVSVERLHRPDRKEQVITHPFGQEDLLQAANELVAAADTEVA